MKCENISITSPFIRLDAFLKLSGEAGTGGQAKLDIQEGLIEVDGEICLMRGKKLYPGSKVKIGDRCYEVISGEG